MTDRAPDNLGAEPGPRFHSVVEPAALGLRPPADRLGIATRTWVRSLAGMQKEALVVNGATGAAWRLASDEGPYLDGHDAAPCPLSFFTVGMVASAMERVTEAASARRLELDAVRLVLDNRYTMEGSVLAGTMRGGALAPSLQVAVDSPAPADEIEAIVESALEAMPVLALLRPALASRFSLVHDGHRLTPARVAALDDVLDDPGDRFDAARADDRAAERPLVRRLVSAEHRPGVKHGASSSLQERQHRTLHVRGVCTLEDNGLKRIEQHLYKPIGSTFRFLSDEASGAVGKGRAPDAATYLSAGIGFCFMTQFGRYAHITRKALGAYRIVQDLHLPAGRPRGGPAASVPSGGGAERADPVETHVFLDTEEDADFARTALDMAEQTCFLHALCRTPLSLDVRVDVGALEPVPTPAD